MRPTYGYDRIIIKSPACEIVALNHNEFLSPPSLQPEKDMKFTYGPAIHASLFQNTLTYST